MRGRRVLFPRAQEGLDILPRALEKMGALVDVVSAYRIVPNKVSIKKIGRAFGKNGSHSIVFASRSAEDVFDRLFGKKVKNRAFVLRPL
jgi:uroporphyrinogen-III synthase